jgi:hypothetical protein
LGIDQNALRADGLDILCGLCGMADRPVVAFTLSKRPSHGARVETDI